MPCVICRTIASPEGRLPSGSIHCDPTTIHCPRAMAALMPSQTCG